MPSGRGGFGGEWLGRLRQRSSRPRTVGSRCERSSLQYGLEFEHMAVRIPKIDAAAAVPVFELAVVEVSRCAAERQLRLANAAQDGIEVGIADVEGVD